jgi:hypothetical protein
MPKFRITRIAAAVVLLGACSSTPKEAPEVATLQSTSPAAAAATPGTTAVVGIQLRLDTTEAERLKYFDAYQKCLFDNGVKKKPRDGGSVGAVAAEGQWQLDDSGEPKSAYTACANKKPLEPIELDQNRNPDFAAQWEDNVRCLREHGVMVHTTKPGEWTYDDGKPVPDDAAQIERDCMLKAFGVKKK